ncbi:MAG: diaminopimelate epimerase [bacterium]|nr:diaminopimelate epimerase [bacterium]
MNFIKMHGLGNDYILIDAINQNISNLNPADLAVKLCNRYLGAGADGLILILESNRSDLKMRIFNPDGSEAEMCGNGIRCFAKYVYEQGLIEKEVFSVETLGGIIIPALNIEDNIVKEIEVDMGEPVLERNKIPMVGTPSDIVLAETIKVQGNNYIVTCLSMGNPHAVIFVNDLKTINIEELGPLFENNRLFPEKINTEFVQVVNRNEAIMIVWERGAGKTLACGTGACASVVAGVLNNKLDRKVLVHLPGGPLSIEWQESNNHIVMTGPAESVFKGEIPI